MRILDFVFVIALLAAIVAAPFSFVCWSKYVATREADRVFPLKSFLFFLVPLLSGMLAMRMSNFVTECEAASFLGSVSDRGSVSIDGHVLQNRDEVLNALKQFGGMPAHHSHPTRELQLEISDPPKHLQLVLGRDSDDPQEYWVFAPSSSKLAGRFALKKDIGHIKTPLFDAY